MNCYHCGTKMEEMEPAGRCWYKCPKCGCIDIDKDKSDNGLGSKI